MSDHELAAAYAVDAVDELERARFEQHLVTCPSCTEEVRSLREATAMLASTAAVTAPASLKASVLSEIATTPQVSVPSPTAAPSVSAARRAPWLAIAASVLAIAVVTLGTLFVRAAQQRDELSSDLTAVQEVLTAPDAQTVTGEVGDGHASVVTSASLDRAVFVGTGLDTPPAGDTFQLWVIDADGTPTSAGTFEPDDAGNATRVMEATPTSGEIVGLTVEPDGGSDAPTTTPILAVPLA